MVVKITIRRMAESGSDIFRYRSDSAENVAQRHDDKVL
jgi:hypothetical protein